MANLHNAIINYKQDAIADIIHNPDLVRVLNPDVANAEDLVYKNIFPFFRVPTIDSETLTYITVCVSYPEAFHPENFTRDVNLTICIICHQDEMLTDFGATKLDYIGSKLDDIFLNSKRYGVGKVFLLSSIESSLDQFHRFREIVYRTTETRKHCG